MYHLQFCNIRMNIRIYYIRPSTSQKSLPQTMISDNASTYHSAADELNQLFESLTHKEALGRQRVKWQFIPKRGPWLGGL